MFVEHKDYKDNDESKAGTEKKGKKPGTAKPERSPNMKEVIKVE